jgi:glycosyltransferase involved in cell wall biosynthesis
MSDASPLVSICLPARNGADSIAAVVRSVLLQDHANLELIISDNASTDDTESVCRELARSDSRIVYHRQAENIGLLANFVFTLSRSRGTFIRWIGDDDWLCPDYVSRCVTALSARPEALLATTQIEYVDSDGTVSAPTSYGGFELGSPDPLERFDAVLEILNASTFVVDPLYALMRRRRILDISRKNMFHEDELYAVKLALAAPWVHVPLILAGRNTTHVHGSVTARRLALPAWQLRARTSLLCQGIVREIATSELDKEQKRHAYTSIRRFYLRRQLTIAQHRYRRIRRVAGSAYAAARAVATPREARAVRRSLDRLEHKDDRREPVES